LKHIRENVDRILSSIKETIASAGRKPEDVKLVAVSKNFPAEAISEAYACGLRRFGENRTQELSSKKIILPSDIEWHMIGHLQSNKVIKAITSAEYIHSIDSMELLEKTEKLCAQESIKTKVLLEMNISGEDSKFGIRTTDDLSFLCETALKMQSLTFVGLMTMAPYSAPESELRKIFAGLRDLAEKLSARFELAPLELSMGMSEDYLLAIKEGATLLRIGSAIFGKRQ
jgi:pyridoxal phosphate enzyme (YggS family)